MTPLSNQMPSLTCHVASGSRTPTALDSARVRVGTGSRTDSRFTTRIVFCRGFRNGDITS